MPLAGNASWLAAVLLILTVGGGSVAVGGALVHRHAAIAARHRTEGDAERLVLRVPRLRGDLFLDGDTDDPAWIAPPGPARTGRFLFPNGAPARPYSDARLVWGDGHIYLALYAADEDIRSVTDQADGPEWLDDSFRLVFERDGVEYVIEVSPVGRVADAVRQAGGDFDYAWNSGVHVSHEEDGTVDDSSDEDEEWVIEMAVPLESLGLRGDRGDRVGFAVYRCDSSRNAARVCAGWGDPPFAGEIVLD